MKKEERIEKYGIEAYEKYLQQTRDWRKEHPEEAREAVRRWFVANPDKAKADNQEQNRKGGKRYEQRKQYRKRGIPHEKELIRHKHQNRWSPYKQIIAPDSQLHHEWIPETANFRGVAFVEKDQHMHGFIDVIQILEGEITLFREEEIKNIGGEKYGI